MDLTLIFSDTLGTPGLREQIPLVIKSTLTPAVDAR